MAFDAEFLGGVLGDEGKTSEEKVQLIIAEHDASERGLVQKRDELLSADKKHREALKGYEAAEAGYKSRLSEMEEQLKKNSGEELKKYYDGQLGLKQKEFEDKSKALAEERDFYKKSHLQMLRSKAIEDGIKDFQFVDGLRGGFVARVMEQGFEAKDVGGSVVFLNKDNHTISDAIKAFAMTAEGKAYLKAASSGAGSRGSSGSGGGSKTMTRAEFESLNKTNPRAVADFFRGGGTLVD